MGEACSIGLQTGRKNAARRPVKVRPVAQMLTLSQSHPGRAPAVIDELDAGLLKHRSQGSDSILLTVLRERHVAGGFKKADVRLRNSKEPR